MRVLFIWTAFCLFFTIPARAQDKYPDCNAPPANLVAGNAKIAITVKSTASAPTPINGADPAPVWQPRGGTVAFTMRGNGVSLDGAKVAVCFGWKDGELIPSPNVWVTSSAGDEVTYNTVVPQILASAPSDAARTALNIVPLAKMRVFVFGTAAANPMIDVARPVGITQPYVSAAFALIGILSGLAMFYWFAKLRNVHGGGVLLWLISTRNGYASLSQLQIMLWTFVVGASAIYVMTLSGGLIEITSGTLILLGMAGTAAVGSKLHSGQEDSKPQSAPADSAAAPGQPPYLFVVGTPAADEVRLVWAPPMTGAAPTEYSVQYRKAGTSDWCVVNETVQLPRHTVLGLEAGTDYEFQVQAVRAGVLGLASSLQKTRTAPAPSTPTGVPGPVSGLWVDGAEQASSIQLAWYAASNDPSGYVVQYRLHDSAEAWRPQTVTQTSVTLGNLESGVQYDVRAAAVNTAGQGPWTSVLACRTTRAPQLSDLVVTGDGCGEVDVTRVQMLFFTVITAIFVLSTVAVSYQIPAIPDGFVLLMGISNGLYVGSKFVSG